MKNNYLSTPLQRFFLTHETISIKNLLIFFQAKHHVEENLFFLSIRNNFKQLPTKFLVDIDLSTILKMWKSSVNVVFPLTANERYIFVGELFTK